MGQPYTAADENAGGLGGLGVAAAGAGAFALFATLDVALVVAGRGLGVGREGGGGGGAMVVVAALAGLGAFAIVVEQAPGELHFGKEAGVFGTDETTEVIAALGKGVLETYQHTRGSYVFLAVEHVAETLVELGDVKNAAYLFPADAGIQKDLTHLIASVEEGDVHHEASELVDGVGAGMLTALDGECTMGMFPQCDTAFATFEGHGIGEVLDDARHDILEKACGDEVLDAIAESAALEQLVELVTKALGSGVGHVVGIVADGLPAGGIQAETFLVLETDAAKHSHGILTIDGDRVGGRNQQAVLQIADATTCGVENFACMQVLIERVAGIIATRSIFFKRAETGFEEGDVVIGVFLDMRFNAFNECQRIIDDDVHGCGPVALIIEWAFASIGVFGTHVFDKCLLAIRHIDQKVNVAIAFAQQFIAYTSSYKVNLPVEGRILMDDILDEMEGLFEFIHFRTKGSKWS